MMFELSISVLVFVGTVLAQNDSCNDFKNIYKDACSISRRRIATDKTLQEKGFILSSADLGFGRNRQSVCNASNYWAGEGKFADSLTTAARLIADKDPAALASFESNAKCLGRNEKVLTSRPKYRAMNGYGNNLNHPHWGMAGTTFGRFEPKNYDDDVYSVRKSVAGSDLPSARKVFQEVLMKAPKYPRVANDPNEMINFFILLITHDMAFQVPVESFENCQTIRCCSSGNKKVLSEKLSNSACIPIPIAANDPFYKDAGVGCLNMVRSEITSSPSTIQHGEIRNKVTAFMDLSIIYGSDDVESKKLRSSKGGKLNMGAKNLIPTDVDGKYTPVSNRLTSVPQSALFPAIFARNHNNICDGLLAVNPKWKDEKLFQEARRINIASFQNILLGGSVIQQIFKRKVNVTYSENFDPSTMIEFTTAGYRFLHYYLNSNIKLTDKDNNATLIPSSDAFGRIDLVEDRFDDFLRGAMGQKMNYGEYSDEVSNKFAKNQNGVGLDIFSFDIQRGRDHGLPTFLDTRRKCGFIANFTTFDDLIAIFPQSYIELLKNVYASVEDIDLYVGGSLESFLTIREALVGETFACIIGEQHQRVLGGDAYFFSNPDSPYPFTPAQIAAVKTVAVSNLICVNSGLDSIQKLWYLVENNSYNTKVPCSLFKQIDFSAWKDV